MDLRKVYTTGRRRTSRRTERRDELDRWKEREREREEGERERERGEYISLQPWVITFKPFYYYYEMIDQGLYMKGEVKKKLHDKKPLRWLKILPIIFV